MSIATVATVGATSWAYLWMALPAVVAIALNSVAIYMAFTVMHESMHGVAHDSRRVNAWLGRPMALMLTFSMPVFRSVHYEHHSHTNDTDRDPDLFISYAPKWLVPLWATGVLLEYRRHYYGRKLWRNRRELSEAIGIETLVLAVAVVSLVTGNFISVAVLWFIPACVAAVFLVVAFDYLPHYPYDSRQRYHDTRIYPGGIANVILLGQNYHLIHHLWTTVPWYRYRRVFHEIRPELEARGARIGWWVDGEKTAVAASPEPQASI